MARAGVWAMVALALAACSGSSGAPRPLARSREGLSPNPIVAENQLPGTADWQLNWWAGPHVIEGYAGEVSVNHGEPVDIHLSADAPHAVHWELFRMGYYGGLGARLITQGDTTASPQVLPAVNTTTGLVECQWPTSFVIQTDPSWTSGFYVVRLTRDDGPQQYVSFVVRADEQKGAAVFQASVTTYEAYNDWGGESLYADRALGLAGGHAREVSFNRPYVQGGGMGEFNRYEMYFVQWAESRGYDLTYLTDVDLDRDPSLLAGQKLFMSVGHDEYWSRAQRQAVEGALAQGVNLAFFSGNAVYWQIRLEPSRADGTPRRTEVCWKDDSNQQDPLYGQPTTTVMFREPPLDDPETALMGVMYDAWQLADSSWVVENAGNWVYAGTGARDGDTIPLIVGYESDRIWSNGRTPAGVVPLASEPAMQHDGSPTWHNAAVYTAPSGAFVFAAGTIEFSWGLAKPLIADARVQRMAANVLERAGLEPSSDGDSFGAGTWPAADTSDAAGTVTTIAGTPFQTGMNDGPAAQATFNRPTGAAIDGSGNIYLADTGNDAIRRIANDAAHTVTTIAGTGRAGTGGSGPGTQTALWAPTAVAISPSGDIYVADTGNERILEIDSVSLNVSIFAGSPVGEPGSANGQGTSARFAEPSGLAFVGSDLYVADTSNSLIRKVDAQGNVTTIAGTGDGYADGPGASAAFYRPTSIASADGALWVVDANNRLLRKIALGGAYIVSTIAGATPGGFLDGPALDAQLMPWFGIFEQGGDVYWTDTGNQRVRELAGSAVETIAGSGAEAPADGPAASAGFVLPSAIVPMADGRFLIVDNGSSTLRVLDRGGSHSSASDTGTSSASSSSASSTTESGSMTGSGVSSASSGGEAESGSSSSTTTSGATSGGIGASSSATSGSTAASISSASSSSSAGSSGGARAGSTADAIAPNAPAQTPVGRSSGGCGTTGSPFELAALLAALAIGRRARAPTAD